MEAQERYAQSVATRFQTEAPENGQGRVNATFADSLRMAQDKFKRKARQKVYYYHPEIWAKEVLGFDAWSKQVDIGNSLVQYSYTAVKSCHGAGKSAWAAVLVCWFVSTRLEAGENVFVITTAPSYPQVHLVLWEEIRRNHVKGNLPGYITQGDAWKINTGTRTIELAVGRKPADTDANSFQGKHEDQLLIVLDEANGIPTTLYTGATSMLTGDMNRQKMLAIGNPDDPSSQFGLNDAKDKGRIAEGKKPFWNTIQIRAADTPNFTDEDVPDVVRKNTLQKTWVEDRREEWGEDDPRWISKVLAEFPDASEDAFYSMGLIEQAKAQQPDPGWQSESRRLGVDVSRFGGDRTVVVLYDKGICTIIDSWSKMDSIATGLRIHMLATDNEVTEVRIDSKNMGAGVVDYLRVHMAYNYRVVEMDANAAAPDNTRWLNARAYWYDSLKYQMLRNKIQIPTHASLDKELSQIKYRFTRGALQMEPKEELKKRLGGESPDFMDALVYAAADLYGVVPEDGVGKFPAPGQSASIDIALQKMIEQATRGWSVSPV